jgi:Zn-dependent protease with chaperone function
MEDSLRTLDAFQTTWFDGRSPAGQPVTIFLEQGRLHVNGLDVGRHYSLSEVRWPEKMHYGRRMCDLPDGSSLQHAESAQWDAWFERQGFQPSWVVVSTLSWRRVVASVLCIVMITVVVWQWGIPAASKWVAPQIPEPLQQRIGSQALDQMRGMWLQPSRIAQSEQTQWRERFEQMVKKAQTHDAFAMPPKWQLHFYKAPVLRANAFALPGGVLVLTDDMVELLQDQPDVLMGVLAHELGHVEHHHGMQMVLKTSLMSALVGAVIGDAGSFLTTIPLVLASQGYSRDAEREADEAAALFLSRNGIHPRVMAVMFERLRMLGKDKTKDTSTTVHDILPIGLASHPSDAQRIAFFTNWVP